MRRDSGFVFLASLLMLVSAMMLSAVGLTRSFTEISVTSRHVAIQQAFQLAEAGLDDALVEFRSGGSDGEATFDAAEGWTDAGGAACASGTPCLKTVSLPAGNATIQVSDIGATLITLTSSSTVAGAPQTVEMVIERPPASLFNQAIFGETGIQINKDTLVDSYDSTLGPYTPAPATGNRSADADLRTNSTDVGAISIHKNTIVNGDVWVGDGGTASVVINNQGTITGTQHDKENLALPPIAMPNGSPCGDALIVPAGQTMTLDVGSFCHSSISIGDNGWLILNGDGQIILGNSGATDLAIPANATLEITGSVSLVAGDVNLTNWLNLTASSAKLYLYVKDSMVLEGAINTSADPKKLQLLYDGTQKLTLTKDGDFYGAIYAPNAEVEFNKDGDIYGAVIAKFFYMKKTEQSGGFHYDQSLRDTIFGNGSSEITIRSWRQP